MRYSVYVSGRMPLAYYSPEMTGFYNTDSNLFNFTQTIALLEMTGFYNCGGMWSCRPTTTALLGSKEFRQGSMTFATSVEI